MPFDLAAPPPEPEEVELLPGLTVTVRPLTGLRQCQAEAELNAVMESARGAGAIAGRFGLDPGALADPNRRQGLGEYVWAVTLGVLTITGWNVLETGKPAPVDEARIARIFERWPAAMSTFRAHMLETARKRAAEGNVFAASPSTTSGEAAITAEAATEPTPPAAEDSPAAPASTAPPPSTRRKSPKPPQLGAPSATIPEAGAEAEVTG